MRPSTRRSFAALCLGFTLAGCTKSELTYIAHAGGGYNEKTYTNSIDALEANAPYFKFFEIDLNWTSDGFLVCNHDWENERSAPTFQVFVESLASSTGPRPCTMKLLAKWLQENPTKKVITDIKSNNLAGLEYIRSRHKNIKHQIIPQIYKPDEYEPARALGYKDVIWTLYRYPATDPQIIKEAAELDLFALTVPHGRVKPKLISHLSQRGIKTFVHTINDPIITSTLQQAGATGIYTDSLKPQRKSRRGHR